jgi:hypothetical protein
MPQLWLQVVEGMRRLESEMERRTLMGWGGVPMARVVV